MAVHDILDYFRSFDSSSYAVFACQGNEPSLAEIEAFESEVGFALPAEYREFTVSPLGGLYMEVREELWPRAEVYSVGPFWSFLYGIGVLGISSTIPEWLDVRHEYREMKAAGFPELVPFLTIIGDADPYCFERSGAIVRWRHDEPDQPESVEGTFSEIVMREIRNLEQRKAWKTEGRD